MVPKTVFTAAMCATLLAWSGLSAADEYRPGQFLTLDLSKALLSPEPLGPSAQFVPGPIEAGADPGPVAQARVEPEPEPAPAVAAPKTQVSRTQVSKTRVSKIRVAHLRAPKPRAAVRTRLARQHSNPLDAQAFDTRIQVWPCRTGGICNWQPSAR
jgi:hypothetical protein